MKTTHPINPIRDFLKLHAFRSADADCHRPRKPNQAPGALKPILKTAAWMLALTSLTCWNAMAQNLVSNPDFELGAPSTGYPAGSTDLPGWTVDIIPSDGVQHYYADILGATQIPNTKVLQLTGGAYTDGGGVQQSIATTEGVTYTISIDVASRNGGSLTGNFNFGGQNQTLSASSTTFTTLTWTVIASSASTLIDITGSTFSNSVQLLIDNVSVTPPQVASADNSTVTAAPASVPADGTSASTITVTLRDASNYPVAGKTVTLAHTAGPGTPTINTISGITGGTGIATFTVATTTVGAATFTATDVTDGNLPITETATVNFIAPVVVAWGPAMDVTADTDVATNGVLQYAEHWGGSDQTINGVPFTAAGTNVTKSDGNSYTYTVSWPQGSLSTEYYNLLQGIWYGANNQTVTLHNLTPGHLYQVQMWSMDKRYSTSQMETYGGDPSVSLSIGTGQYAIGTFTANGTTINIPVTGDGIINAVVVRDLSVMDDYAAWSGPSGYNLVEGPAGDDDKDGLTNHEEYAFGLDPTGGASVNPIVVQLNKTAKTFSYTRRDTSKTDLTYSVWFSTNLSTWTEDTGATEGTPVLTGEVETVQVTLSSLPGDPLPATLFIQVRAN